MNKINYNYDPNKQLCVYPTGSESQYESFQAIFAHIMAASYGDMTQEKSPYELLCIKNKIKLMNKRPTKTDLQKYNKIIFFKKPTSGSTHYIAYLNAKKLDPYDYFQANKTQGFCQMFAYFLVMNDIANFKKVDQSKKIDVDNFNKLSFNTQCCLKKSLNIIKNNDDIKKKFKSEFKNIMNDSKKVKYYGIKKKTTLNKYLSDFKKINDQLIAVKHYIYDQPLKGYRKNSARPELWNSYIF